MNDGVTAITLLTITECAEYGQRLYDRERFGSEFNTGFRSVGRDERQGVDSEAIPLETLSICVVRPMARV